MLTLGDSVFDPSTRRLCGRGDEHRLSPKATGVLLALAETRGRVWSRDALLERVWPNVIVGEEVLTHAVAELRRALGDDFRQPALIETIHKSGYRLLGEPDNRATSTSVDEPKDGDDAIGAYAEHLDATTQFERGGRNNLECALNLYKSSIERDSTYSPSYAGAAKTILFLSQYYAPWPDAFESALELCSTARRHDPGYGEALAVEALAHAMYGDRARAHRLFRGALRLSPRSGEVHELLGRACFAHLQPEFAAPVFERAAALRVDDFSSLVLAATASEMVHDFDRARVNYIRALARLEMRLAAAPDEYRPLASKAHCLIQLERHAEAASVLGSVCAHPEPVPHSPACVLALAGEGERAMDALEDCIESGWRYGAWLQRDPCLNSLRSMPRFQRLARAINA